MMRYKKNNNIFSINKLTYDFKLNGKTEKWITNSGDKVFDKRCKERIRNAEIRKS